MPIMHNGFTLVHQKTGIAVEPNESVPDFRGDLAIVTGGYSPHKFASSGRIHVKFNSSDADNSYEYYPSVYNCEWRKS